MNQALHHVHAVISAADDWMQLDEEAIAARVLEDLYWAMPGSRGSGPRRGPKREGEASDVPGMLRASTAIRPSARPGGFGVPNLYLAGDWCDTGLAGHDGGGRSKRLLGGRPR